MKKMDYRRRVYKPLTPSRPFASLSKASGWVEKFVFWYNNIHLHSGIKFVKPMSRNEGKDKMILKIEREFTKKQKIKIQIVGQELQETGIELKKFY